MTAPAVVRRPPRVFAIPTNRNAPPPGASELFGTVTDAIPNDGAAHPLQDPNSSTGLIQWVNTGLGIYLRWLRFEWQTIDFTQPYALRAQLLVNGQLGFGLAAPLILQPLAVGTPAVEFSLHAYAPPGSVLSITAINTSATVTPHVVSAYVWGWQLSRNTHDGASYAA